MELYRESRRRASRWRYDRSKCPSKSSNLRYPRLEWPILRRHGRKVGLILLRVTKLKVAGGRGDRHYESYNSFGGGNVASRDHFGGGPIRASAVLGHASHVQVY